MKKFNILMFIILSLIFLKSGFSQTVDEIVDNHAKAMGGADKLLSLKTVKYDGKFSDGGADIPTVTTIKREDKARIDMTYQGMDMIKAYDGRVGWFIDPFQGKKKQRECLLKKLNE